MTHMRFLLYIMLKYKAYLANRKQITSRAKNFRIIIIHSHSPVMNLCLGSSACE